MIATYALRFQGGCSALQDSTRFEFQSGELQGPDPCAGSTPAWTAPLIFKPRCLTVLPRASAGLGRCLSNDSQSRDLTLPTKDAVTPPRFRLVCRKL